MKRAHLYRPIQDSAGNIRTGAQVRVFDADSTTLTATPLYVSDLGTATMPSVFTTASGVVEFYTDAPTRFRLGIKVGDEPEVMFENIDCLTSDGGGSDVALQAHLDDPSDAHDASAVSFVPTADNSATDVQAAIEAALTKHQADLLYAPGEGPAGPDVPDPETGAPRTIIPKFTLQAIVSGPLSVNTDLIKPGLRVPQASKMFAVIAHAAVAPGTDGTDGTYIDVTRWNSGAYVENVAQVYIPGGQTVGVQALDPVDYVDFAKGDMVKFVCWAPGVTPAEDVSISLDFL